MAIHGKRRCDRPLRWLLLLVVVHTGLVAFAAWRQAPTVDEPARLAAGISHWRYVNFDLFQVNPPLVRLVATVPVLATDFKSDWSYFRAGYARSEFQVGGSFMKANGALGFRYLTLARLACIPFAILGLLVCYAYARDLYGHLAGLFASALWCFSPNIIANASLLTEDAPAASLTISCIYAFWLWLRSRTWTAAMIVGIVTGLCLGTKLTLLVLLPLLPVLWIIWLAGSRRKDWRAERRGGIQLAFILTTAIVVLNFLYAFQDTCLSLADLHCESDSGQQIAEYFEGTAVAQMPIPLPRRFIEGIDLQKRAHERGVSLNYLRGTFKHEGWWYYYLYALAVKTPLGTISLAIIAFVCGARRAISRLCSPRRNQGHCVPDQAVVPGDRPVGDRDIAILLLPPTLILVFVSSQTEINRHLRFVLPVFPFLFVWCTSIVKARFLPLRRYRKLPRKLVASLFIASSVVSSLAIYPYSYSYFNELAGGPLRGHYHLLNSNIDWGQEGFQLADFVAGVGSEEEVFVFYFGSPSTMRICGVSVSSLEELADRTRKTESLPAGWYAVSVEYLYRKADTSQLSQLRQRKPDGRLGYSIYLYHVQ